MIRPLSATGMILLACAGAAVSAELPMREVTVYGGLATLAVPAAFHEIPPEVLEYYSLSSAERSGGLVAEVYQYGFRPGDPEADFAPPQILIQIRESGRLNYREFLRLPPLESLRRGTDREVSDRAGPFVDDAVLNEVRFDRERYVLRVDNTLELSVEGTVLVKSASFLTERGTFTVHCYTHLADNTALRSTFEIVFESVRLDEILRYRPRLADRLPPRPARDAYAVALVLAVLTLVIYLVQRRRGSA